MKTTKKKSSIKKNKSKPKIKSKPAIKKKKRKIYENNKKKIFYKKK